MSADPAADVDDRFRPADGGGRSATPGSTAPRRTLTEGKLVLKHDRLFGW